MVIIQLLLQLGLLGAVLFLIWIQRQDSKEKNKNLTAMAEFQVKTYRDVTERLIMIPLAPPESQAAGDPEPGDHQAADSPETLPVAPEIMGSPELIPGYVVRIGCGVVKADPWPACQDICPWPDCIATMEVRHITLNPPPVFDHDPEPGDPEGDPNGVEEVYTENTFCFAKGVSNCPHLREDGTCFGECEEGEPGDPQAAGDPDGDQAGDPPAEKPKREMTEAQKEALAKGRQTRKDNIEKRKEGNS